MILTTSFSLALVLSVRADLASASFGGCYAPPLDLEGTNSTSTGNISTIEECSIYCSAQEKEYTVSLFIDNSTSCTCSFASPPSSSLLPAQDDSCPSGSITASLLNPNYSFISCSRTSSPTAQFVSSVPSSHQCLDQCSGYPYIYAFPTGSTGSTDEEEGWNCYCAMSSSTESTTCSDDTFYAYAKQPDVRRSRR